MTQKALHQRRTNKAARRKARGEALTRAETKGKPERTLKGRRDSKAKRRSLVEDNTRLGVERLKGLGDPPEDANRPSLMAKVRAYQKAAKDRGAERDERREQSGVPKRQPLTERAAVTQGRDGERVERTVPDAPPRSKRRYDERQLFRSLARRSRAMRDGRKKTA